MQQHMHMMRAQTTTAKMMPPPTAIPGGEGGKEGGREGRKMGDTTLLSCLYSAHEVDVHA